MREQIDPGEQGSSSLYPFLNMNEYPDPLLTAGSVAAAGWPVIPIWPTTKRPIGAGGDRHQGIWLTDPGDLVKYGENHHEQYGRWPSWAAILGEPNQMGLRLVVLDTDSAPAEQRLRGVFEEMPEARMWADQTLTVTTPRGVHRYGITRARTGTGKPWEDFDFKSSGYVLLPGALHPDGARYEDSSPMNARQMVDGQPGLAVFRGYSHDFAAQDWARVMSLPTTLLARLTVGIPDDAREDLATGEGRPPLRQAESQAFSRFVGEMQQLGRKVERLSGTHTLVSCPGPTHTRGDRHPSLSVTGIEGKVLLKCFAGCETADIMAAIGWSLSDLFDAEEQPAVEILDPEPSSTSAQEAPERGTRYGRFVVYDRADMMSMTPPREIIKGVLPARGALVMLAGAFGLGKSLLALSLAAAISTGAETWNERKVREHGRVLYVSLEGFHNVPDRMRAWESFYGQELDNILWFPEKVDLRKPVDSTDLAVTIEEMGDIMMVVMDSARASGAGKEDTEDMGDFVRGVESLRNRTGVTPLILHNTGWDGSRSRGSTLLPDAMDTSLILTGKPTGMRTLKHDKHRDGNMLEGIHFQFEKVQVRVDEEDGNEPVISGVMRPATRTEAEDGTATVTMTDERMQQQREKAAREDPTRSESLVETCMRQIMNEAFGWETPDVLLSKAEIHDRITMDATAATFKRALKALTDQGMLVADGSTHDRQYRLSDL